MPEGKDDTRKIEQSLEQLARQIVEDHRKQMARLAELRRQLEEKKAKEALKHIDAVEKTWVNRVKSSDKMLKAVTRFVKG